MRENIGKGIASLGPTMTLDTLVEVLLISIGTISGKKDPGNSSGAKHYPPSLSPPGVPRFETMCCFGCMSIVANYLVFMTFFPASLALVLEVCPHDPSNSGWHLDNLARELQEEETKKQNPVAQRVKVIMALGLAVVHMHSRFLSSVTGWSFAFDLGLSGNNSKRDSTPGAEGEMEMVPLPDYLWWKMFNLSIDQVIILLQLVFYDVVNSSSLPTDLCYQSLPPALC